jgi:nitrite reductase/ring-hydroxylating ferredoxin subunit
MRWHDVCAATDIPADRGWPVSVEGRPVALFRVGGELHALANRCLHIGFPIDDGVVTDVCVTCPWHGWRYDLRTGAHLTFFGSRPGLETYPVRERDGRIEVAIGA